MVELSRALRALAHKPAFSLSVMWMFALGIAANVAVFSIFDGMYLDSLPYPDAQRLVYLSEAIPSRNIKQMGVAYLDLEAWGAGNGSFNSMSAFIEAGGYLTGAGDPLPGTYPS